MRWLEFLDAYAVNLVASAYTHAEVVSLPMAPITMNFVESASILESHFAKRC